MKIIEMFQIYNIIIIILCNIIYFEYLSILQVVVNYI